VKINHKFDIGDIINVEGDTNNPWKIIGVWFNENKIIYTLSNEHGISRLERYEEDLEYARPLEPKQYMELITSPISLGFEDVAIQQAKNICSSRLDVNLRSEVFRDMFLDIPIIAANMSTVVDADFCIRLRELGALGVMHRALPEEEYLAQIKKISDKYDIVAASIGVGDNQFELCKKLVDCGANVIVIDIAHGFSQPVIDLGRRIKNEIKDVKVIVGNSINPNMLYEVNDFADAVKFGIANGASCETKNTAGCNEKQFSCILKCKEISKHLGLPIISDGGIREGADIVKAIGAGAMSVMVGSALARCPESAGEIIEINGVRKKIFAGMSSRRVQESWRGMKRGTCPEGKAIYLDLGEPVDALLERYSGALRSGITYAGANDIETFQERVRFVRFK
jgi:IMP dehydrogenase